MKNRVAKGKRLAIVILAIALALLLLVTACAHRPVAEEETVQSGWVIPLTGPGGGAASQAMLQGGQDYIRYFNEQETIPGVRVEVLWRDTCGQAAVGVSHYERLVEAGVPLTVFLESPLLFPLKARFERDQVVGFTWGGGMHDAMYPEPGWVYTTYPVPAETVAVLLQYFMQNWKEEGPPHLAFVSFDAGWGYSSRYATEYARGLGFEVLPWETVPIVPLDATVHLLRLKEAGADLVHLQMHTEAAGPILRDAERLGLLDEFQFAGDPATMGDRTMKIAGAATEGFLVARPYPWFSETEVPGIRLMLDNQMKYHGKETREGEYYFGWVGAAVMCEAISRAIEKLGYENLDGLAIKEALDGMQDFDVYALASVTYKPDDHRGATKMSVYEVRGGEIVRVSDWLEAPSARDWEYKW